jgi:hypothetical protein
MSTKALQSGLIRRHLGKAGFMAGEGKAMGARSWNLVAGFILAGTIVWTPAAKARDGDWSGAGWYIGDVLALMAGPYSTKADCKRALSALPADRKSLGASCDYIAKDPLKH